MNRLNMFICNLSFIFSVSMNNFLHFMLWVNLPCKATRQAQSRPCYPASPHRSRTTLQYREV